MIPDTIRCIECEKLLDPATRYLTCEGCRIMCLRDGCTHELSPIYAERYSFCPDCDRCRYECEYCGEVAFTDEEGNNFFDCNSCESYAQKAWDRSNYAL